MADQKSVTVLFNEGLSRVLDAGYFPYFSLKYFLPIYDPNTDQSIHDALGAGTGLEVIATSASVSSATKTSGVVPDDIEGRLLWKTTSADNYTYILDTTGDYAYSTIVPSTTSLTTTMSKKNTYTTLMYDKTTSATSGIQENNNSTYVGTEVEYVSAGIFSSSANWSTLQTVSAFELSAWDRDYLFDTINYVGINPSNGSQGTYTLEIGSDTQGSFKFNKILIFLQKMNSNGTVDTAQDPIPFAMACLNTNAFKYDINDPLNSNNINSYSAFISMNFSVNSSAQQIYYNDSEYWNKIPGYSGTDGDYALSYKGDIYLSDSSGVDDASPYAKLHVKATSGDMIRLTRDLYSVKKGFSLNKETVSSSASNSPILHISDDDNLGPSVILDIPALPIDLESGYFNFITGRSYPGDVIKEINDSFSMFTSNSPSATSADGVARSFYIGQDTSARSVYNSNVISEYSEITDISRSYINANLSNIDSSVLSSVLATSTNINSTVYDSYIISDTSDLNGTVYFSSINAYSSNLNNTLLSSVMISNTSSTYFDATRSTINIDGFQIYVLTVTDSIIKGQSHSYNTITSSYNVNSSLILANNFLRNNDSTKNSFAPSIDNSIILLNTPPTGGYSGWLDSKQNIIAGNHYKISLNGALVIGDSTSANDCYDYTLIGDYHRAAYSNHTHIIGTDNDSLSPSSAAPIDEYYNIGSYNTLQTTTSAVSSAFNLGFNNTLLDVTEKIFTFGHTNYTSGVNGPSWTNTNDIFIIGGENTVKAADSCYVFGAGNYFNTPVGMESITAAVRDSYIIGTYNYINTSTDSFIIGSSNQITTSNNANVFGTSNINTGNSSTVIGASNTNDSVNTHIFGYNNEVDANGTIALGARHYYVNTPDTTDKMLLGFGVGDSNTLISPTSSDIISKTIIGTGTASTKRSIIEFGYQNVTGKQLIVIDVDNIPTQDDVFLAATSANYPKGTIYKDTSGASEILYVRMN